MPLLFNEAQKVIHKQLEKQLNDTGKVRALILKGRQQGCSTYVGARFYHRSTRNKGSNVFILTHEDKATENLFNMVNRYHNHCNGLLRPPLKRSSAKKLSFHGLDSEYSVGTAGNKNTGRSITTKYFHGSEVAFWKNTDDISTGALQTVADLPGTEIVLESTANGMGNMFHKMCMAARRCEGDYILIFIPWFCQSEYRREIKGDFQPDDEEMELQELYGLSDEQLSWRRAKIYEFQGETWKFRQEYPCNPDEAFQTSGDSLIPVEDILRARQSEIKDRDAPLIMGVDPASVGDRAAIVFRRGREIPKVYSFDTKKDPITPMEFVGKLAVLIKNHKPNQVFIDLGEGGRAIVDRLVELGFSRYVTGIHFGSKPSDPVQYLNKRAEMWCEMRDWIKEGDCSIPDDDEIQADLTCVPMYKITSSSRIQLVSKDKIKQDYGKSPDIGDAMALTFAMPVISDVAMTVEKINKEKSGITTLQRRRSWKRGN